jgi:hypothetical protein
VPLRHLRARCALRTHPYDDKCVQLQHVPGVYFGLYDSARDANPLRDDPGVAGLLSKWALAQSVAVTAGYASYPFDTVSCQPLEFELQLQLQL